MFLLEWFEEDMNVILDDYARILRKLKIGRAHELSGIGWELFIHLQKEPVKGRLEKQPFSDVMANNERD